MLCRNLYRIVCADIYSITAADLQVKRKEQIDVYADACSIMAVNTQTKKEALL